MRHAGFVTSIVLASFLGVGLLLVPSAARAITSFASIEFSTEIGFYDGTTGSLHARFEMNDLADLVLENAPTFSIFYGAVDGSIHIDGELVWAGGPAELSFVSNHDGEERDGFQFNAGGVDHIFSFGMDDSTGTAFGSVLVDEPFLDIVGAGIFEDFDPSAFDSAWIAGEWFSRDLRYESSAQFAGSVRNAPPVPEPGAAMVFGAGLVTVGAWMRARSAANRRPAR